MQANKHYLVRVTLFSTAETTAVIQHNEHKLLIVDSLLRVTKVNDEILEFPFEDIKRYTLEEVYKEDGFYIKPETFHKIGWYDKRHMQTTLQAFGYVTDVFNRELIIEKYKENGKEFFKCRSVVQ